MVAPLRLSRPIYIFVTDLRRAVDFYTEKLGFKVVKQRKKVVALDAGGYLLHLEDTGGKPIPKAGGPRAIFYADRIDEVFEALKARDVRFLQPPTTIHDVGGRYAYLEDPDGNLLEIHQPSSQDYLAIGRGIYPESQPPSLTGRRPEKPSEP